MKKERKQDLRVVKTKNLIKSAFLELIEMNGYSKVTVTDIVDKAMINRNTFYLHYYDKEDLINEMISENYKKTEPLIRKILFKRVKEYLKEPIKMQEQIFKDILEYLLEEVELYRIFIMDPGLSGYLNRLKATIKNKIQGDLIKNDKQRIAFEFAFEGTYGCIIEWIKNDYAQKEIFALELSHLYNQIWTYVYNNESLYTILKASKGK